MIMLPILFFTMIVLYCLKLKKSLHMLQQNLYNENNRYIKWMGNNLNIFANVEIINILLLVIAIALLNTLTWIVVAMSIIYILAIYNLKKKIENDQNKKPLVVTARINRLIVTNSILFLIPTIILIININIIENFKFILLLLVIMNYLNALIIMISKIINTPIEKIVYYYYFNTAKTKLKKMNNMKVIGIAGSYGKTTSKNILTDVLSVNYNTLPTPKNLNTPFGLMITINNYLDKFTDIFIAEMGAYKKGEIKNLVKFAKPKYGILTNLGTDHLDSYGSEENIKIGNFELIEGLPSSGLAVLNGDDPKQLDYVKNDLKNKVVLKWIGIENKDVDVYAENIKVTHKGVSFDVIFKGSKKKHKFETKLLGSHNVYNILAAIVLGIELGIGIEDLKNSVTLVKPVEHRLELKRLGNFYQIDDAYNSNPVGAKSACEVLGMMPGIKVVVTPGMTELADKEYELNKVFGTQIAAVADYAVLIGSKRTKPIKDGLIEAGFDCENIIVYNDVKEAYKFINGLTGNGQEVYALFENDLPDIYNE